MQIWNIFYALMWLTESRYNHLNPLTPKIADFLTYFWPLLTKRKREYIMTKPCIIMFLDLLFRFIKSKLRYRELENQYGRFFLKKYRKFEIFFILLFFKWIKHIDLFQTMDKGGQNSCSLWKIFFGLAPYVLSFLKWWKTMGIWRNTRFSMTFLR